MVWFFLIALILAIPTYGVSVLLWLVCFVLMSATKGVAEAHRKNYMRTVRNNIETYLGGTPYDFLSALDIPQKELNQRTHKTVPEGMNLFEAGEHILNFISYNSDILKVAFNALEYHEISGDDQPISFVKAARFEREWVVYGPVHYLVYFSIITLAKQNDLSCFRQVDLEKLGKDMEKISSYFHDFCFPELR